MLKFGGGCPARMPPLKMVSVVQSTVLKIPCVCEKSLSFYNQLFYKTKWEKTEDTCSKSSIRGNVTFLACKITAEGFGRWLLSRFSVIWHQHEHTKPNVTQSILLSELVILVPPPHSAAGFRWCVRTLKKQWLAQYPGSRHDGNTMLSVLNYNQHGSPLQATKLHQFSITTCTQSLSQLSQGKRQNTPWTGGRHRETSNHSHSNSHPCKV